MIYNTAVSGLDEAAFLIALGFPFQLCSKVETVDLSSQTRRSAPDRLSWKFGDISTRGEGLSSYREHFMLPPRGRKATHLAARARIAACNFLALKSAIADRRPLTQYRENGWTLLRNGAGESVPQSYLAADPSWCCNTAALAISTAFGCRLAEYSLAGDILRARPEPADPGITTPQQAEAVILSSAPADPNDFSPLAVLAAMFFMRQELLAVAYRHRRLSLSLGRKHVILAADASEKAKDLAFQHLTNHVR